MNWETLLCLGDSITIGARSYLGYPEYTGVLLEKHLGNRWNIVNHATCGHTAIDLHRSITNYFTDLQCFNPSLLTILIGTNDLKAPSTVENYRIAYRQVLLKASLMVNSAYIFLIKIPKLPAVVKYPYRFEMNHKIDQFNAVIEELAEAYGHKVVEINLTEAELFDGVHLNERGAKSFAKQLTNFILYDKGIPAANYESTAIVQ